MLTPTNYDMFQGESFVLNLQVKNLDGSPKNLAGAKLYLTVKYNYADNDTQAVFQGSSTGGAIIITLAAAGYATATMPPSATNPTLLNTSGDLDLNYDVKVIDSAGIESIAQFGVLTVHCPSTQALS